jgi:predicted nuclease of predicted toxin-antitoxin system
VKLLFDENLSRKLCFRLHELYPGAKHVADVDLLHASDADIWDHAKVHGYVIVTTDSDFFDIATSTGPPPKVVWLRRWAHSTRDAEALLRREAIRISEFAQDPDLGVLVLDLA